MRGIESIAGASRERAGDRGATLVGCSRSSGRTRASLPCPSFSSSSFARAVLVDPAIFILDEATSNIDTCTEAIVQGALKELLTGHTSVVIAHRLSTIRDADKIQVVENGRIAENGTHAELLATGDLYADLYRRQFRETAPAPDG